MYEHIKLKPIRLLLNLYKYRESRKDLNDSGCIFEPFKINVYIKLKVSFWRAQCRKSDIKSFTLRTNVMVAVQCY